MKVLLGAVLVSLTFLSVGQIPDFGGKTKAEKMEKMAFMVGEWAGSGWAIREGRRSEFKSSELIEVKAGGTVFAVTGKHWVEIPGREPLVIHDAYGFLSYDLKDKAFTLTAHLANGMANIFVLNENSTGYKWQTPAVGGGSNEYEAIFSEDTWIEKGFEVKDGKRTQWFEMTLKRKK